jgi:hypothetical protein
MLFSTTVFYYLSYEGSVDLETITDPVEKCSFEAQIQEFGQTPKLLFSGTHPSRNDIGRAVDIAAPELIPSPRKLDTSDSLTNGAASAEPSENRNREDSDVGHSSSCEENGDDDGAITGNRRSMFGFRTRSFGAVPKQAQRFVGGLTAQIRRRMSVEASKRWSWTFGHNGDVSSWAPSARYMLHAG